MQDYSGAQVDASVHVPDLVLPINNCNEVQSLLEGVNSHARSDGIRPQLTRLIDFDYDLQW